MQPDIQNWLDISLRVYSRVLAKTYPGQSKSRLDVFHSYRQTIPRKRIQEPDQGKRGKSDFPHSNQYRFCGSRSSKSTLIYTPGKYSSIKNGKLGWISMLYTPMAAMAVVAVTSVGTWIPFSGSMIIFDVGFEENQFMASLSTCKLWS